MLVSIASRKLRDFKPQHLANTAWAFATLGHRPEALLGPLAEEAGRKLRDFNPQDLANTAWACVAMSAFDEPLLGALWSQAQQLQVQLSGNGLCQLHQVRIIAGKESPACIARELDASLQSRMQLAWHEAKQVNKASSRLHLDVSRVLSAMGVEHENEGAEDIDIVVRRGGHNSPIAIEVDGPSHFTSNRPYLELGHTALKTRFLRALGWEVLRVPFFEWDELIGSREGQRQYMERRLAGVGGIMGRP